MHHAYPRECPWPHLAGTTNPLTQEEWLERSDEPIMAGEDDIRALLDQAKSKNKDDTTKPAEQEQQQQELPWLQQEELFVKSPSLPEAQKSGGIGATLGMLATIVLAGGAFLTRN